MMECLQCNLDKQKVEFFHVTSPLLPKLQRDVKENGLGCKFVNTQEYKHYAGVFFGLQKMPAASGAQKHCA